MLSVGDEAVGQGALTVSPLQMALIAATPANGGDMPDPQLVLRAQDGDGSWQQVAAEGASRPILSRAEAEMLLSAWHRWDGDQSSGQRGVLGHWGVAVAGEGAPHAWFLGVAPARGATQYAVAALVERADEPKRVVAVGRELLEAAVVNSD
jgi:peptidoglycan glycosyltransferase